MLNFHKSKNTVLISNISIITFLNFAFHTRAASLLASRGLGARGRTSRGRGQDPRGRGRGQDPRGLEAEARPRSSTSLLTFQSPPSEQPFTVGEQSVHSRCSVGTQPFIASKQSFTAGKNSSQSMNNCSQSVDNRSQSVNNCMFYHFGLADSAM